MFPLMDTPIENKEERILFFPSEIKSNLFRVLPEKALASLVPPQHSSRHSSKLVLHTLRRPKGPPLGVILINKLISL